MFMATDPLERTREAARRDAEADPPLTDEQRARVRDLLRCLEN